MELVFKGGHGSSSGRGGRWWTALVILFISTLPVFSQNLLFNGNFETNGGSFADWQISHSADLMSYSGPNIVSGGYNNPCYAQFLYEAEGDDVLSQSVPTTPGAVYDIRFYAEDGGGHNFETSFSFGNFSADLGPAFSIGPGRWFIGWTNFNFFVTATQTESDLSFIISADTGSEFGLDDISVVAVPRLETVAAGGSFEMTVTNSTAPVIVQVSSNLVNWVDVYTNTAPFTFTGPYPRFRYNFYRAKVAM